MIDQGNLEMFANKNSVMFSEKTFVLETHLQCLPDGFCYTK